MKKLLFAFVFLFLTVPCLAEIIIVDNEWPYDFNNIQAAINYSSDGDFIIVFPGTYTGPGNLDIDFLGKAVTVQSIVPTDPYIVAETIIDCNGAGRGFYFHSGEDANSVLAGFTITNGMNSLGGGIYCSSSSPKIADCVITGNRGSGIRCDSGNPIVADCIVSGNSISGRSGDGGGISVFNGLCLIYNSVINGNTANGRGGGIYCSVGSIIKATNCAVTGNSGGSDGGGIFCYNSSSSELANCTISSNSAVRDGGGICCYGSSSPLITGGVITGNSANRYGGGIYCFLSSPTVVNSTITGNSAYYYGGGIYCENCSNPTISNCSITGNSVDSNGAGIYCYNNSNPAITSCTISGNSADRYGGGIYCLQSSPTVVSGTITGNSAYVCGGGIYCEYSNPAISNCSITGNSADSNGAGIYCYNNSNPAITSCTITGNSADRVGGGICCLQSSPTVVSGTITNNSAYYGGGGIYCENSSNPAITNCTITGNSVDSDGGGIYCYNNSNPAITGCTITGNSASGGGGGISCYGGNVAITGCTIRANTAVSGGGLYFGEWSGDPHRLTNCIITGNTASSSGGGLSSHTGAWVQVNNCTFTDNEVNDVCGVGGGISCAENYAFVELNNSILWNNEAQAGGPQIAVGNPFGSPPAGDGPYADVHVAYSDVQGGQGGVWLEDKTQTYTAIWWMNGNINADPCFANSSAGDLHLLSGSSCIDAGDPNYVPGPNGTDFDGKPRVVDGDLDGIAVVDMGAYEFVIAMKVVTKPRGGEVWTDGSTHEINWTSYGIPGTVDIYYSDNNGADWVTIGNNVANTGSIIWHLPEAVDSNQCLVSVEPNVSVPNLISTPSGLFTIHPDSIGPLVVSMWKSLGGDFNRSGLSQNSGPEVGCIKWQFHTNGPVSASPSVGSGGRIHLSSEDGSLYTLDANGQLLWSYSINSPLLSSPSIGPDGSVFVGAENGMLYAIDINGNLRWTFSTESFIYSSPAVSADGNVYACSQDGTLYALSRDGSERWTFETGGVSHATTGSIFASPVIGPHGTIYIAGFYDSNLYALDPNDGSVKWTCSLLDTYVPTSNEPSIVKSRPFTSPVVAPNGTIYQTLFSNPKRFIWWRSGSYHPFPFWYDSRLYAIDPNNGHIIWATNMTETPTQTEYPWETEPDYWFKKYYTNAQQKGAPQYPYTDTDIRSFFLRYYRVNNLSWSESALGPDGTVYVNFDDQYLRAVDPNGSVKWVTSLGWVGGFTLSVGSDGLIYVASDDGYLYVVDPDGKEIARFKGSGGLSFPVITADNAMIICDANNTIWAVSNSGCEGQTAALHKPADLNADWSVNFTDFAVMAHLWLNCTDTSYNIATQTPYCSDPNSVIFLEGDINRDQYIDSADLAELADKWLSQE